MVRMYFLRQRTFLSSFILLYTAAFFVGQDCVGVQSDQFNDQMRSRNTLGQRERGDGM
jgi:hypothetical protein